MTERLPQYSSQYSTDLNHKKFSSQDLLETLDQSHKFLVSANKQLILSRPTVERGINVEGPIKLVLLGDTHLFSIYSNEVAVKMTMDELNKDGSFGIVTGDFIEAMNSNIADHIGSVELNLLHQAVAASKILQPYFYSGKLLALSEGYFGHEGSWGGKVGINAVEMMARFMPMVDPKDPHNTDKWRYMPVLKQGGLLKLKLNNNKQYIIKVFHDPNSGGSDTINRQGGLKNQFLNEDDDLFLEPGEHVDMYIAGHQHHRAVVSKEVYFDRMTRKEKSVVFVQIGASKGTEKDMLDPYLVGQGKGPAFGPGPAIILHQLNGAGNGNADVTKEWVSYGYDSLQKLYEIAKTQHKIEDQLNQAERQNLTQELLSKIVDRVRKPVVEFDSRASGRSPKEKPGRAPLFDDLRWEVKTSNGYPILVYELQSTRYGSSSRDGAPYKDVYADILEQATENPFKFVIAMRHFIDKGVASNYDRKSILKEMTDDLGPIAEQKRLLGLMLSATLLADSWQKDVVKHENYYDRSQGKWKSERLVDEAFRPSDEMYYRSAIKGTPLFVNESLLHLRVGSHDYLMFLLDKLGRSGSEFNLVQGQVQTRKKEHVAADVTTGGHMPLAGFSIYPPRQRIYLVPGGGSNWDAGGKGNDKRVATLGQAIIFLPDQKLAIPASNLAEAGDIFNSYMIDRGLTEDEKRKLTKRTK